MEVLFVLDLIGTAVFAYSGALAARGHGYHILGVLYIALLTAVGGGTVRHLLLQTPGLFWLETSAYAWVVVTAAIASYAIKFRTSSITFYLFDSFSLAVFIALGFIQAFEHTNSIPIAFAMGILSGIGGGLIRDAITSQPPQALSDPVYPFMMFAGIIGCYLSMVLGLSPWVLSVVFVLGVAIVSSFTRERLPAVVAEPPAAEGLSESLQTIISTPERGTRPQSFGRSFAKALTVLIIAAATSVYYFEPTFNNAVAENNADTTVESQDKLLDEKITLARWQLENKDTVAATQTIEEASELNPQHHLLNSLKKERDELNAYQQHIAAAEEALETDNISALQKALQKAAKYDRHGNKFTYLQGALNTRLSHIELEKKHQALAASSVEMHLASAKQHIENKDFTKARQEIKMAESFGVNNDELTKVRKTLDQQILISQATLSDSDIHYAEAQFGKLQRAIELRNLSAIKALTADNNEKHDLFGKLFDRYVEINVQLTEISPADKNITARLELERMRLPDGNFTYPPSQYGVMTVSLALTNNGWTKIQW